MKNVTDIVRDLLKNGAKRVDNAVVKTVSVSRQDNYDRVGLVLARPVIGFVKDMETGEYEESETRIIFVSSYSLGAILADNEDTAFAKRILVQKPKLLELVLSYAKIDLLQEKVEANTDYENPFASNPTPRPIDQDTYINHVVNIQLGRRGVKFIEKLADKLFDVNFDDDDVIEEEI